MNLYAAVLFVHAIAVLLLTAALTMEAWVLMQLRRSPHPSDARLWTGALQSIPVAAIGSLVTIYATGAYLTESLRASKYAWPRMAVLEVVLFALLGIMTGRRMRAIRRYISVEQTDRAAWNALTQSTFLKISLSTRVWIVMGTILLTAAKPGLRESLIIVAGSLVLGLISSFASFGRRSVVSAPKAFSR